MWFTHNAMKKTHPVVICTSERTSRLEYICDWIFNERLSVPYCIITPQEAKSFQEVTFAYGIDLPEAAYRIHASSWLRDSFFSEQKPGLELVGNRVLPVWDATPQGWLPDFFGGIFWSIVRAEEYGGPSDQHGRFPANDSWAFDHHLLSVPWVDQWVKWTAQAVGAGEIKGSPEFRPSLDIDDAFAFRGRGWRSIAGIAADVLLARWSLLEYRGKWLFGGPDPFDQYEVIDHWLGSIKKNTHVFFLLSTTGHPMDHNIRPDKPEIRQLVQGWAADMLVGIHPSYQSMERPDLITDEKRTLEQLTGRPVTDARFHYLRFRLPASYRDLISAGIRADHSMAYPDQTGFRAGTGHPFWWYDLENE